MFETIGTIIGLFMLSFSLVYGLYYLGFAIEAIASFAYGMRKELPWDDE
jgi:hypothetical protein